MELQVETNRGLVSKTDGVLNPPLHDAVGPERSASVGEVAGSSSNIDLSKGSLDKVAWVWNGSRWLADLGHGGGDQVGDNEVDIDVVLLELSTKGSRPLLEEGLRPGVGGKERSWKKTAEGAHGENEAALLCLHLWCDNASDLEGTHAVDGDDVAHLLLGGESEWNWV